MTARGSQVDGATRALAALETRAVQLRAEVQALQAALAVPREQARRRGDDVLVEANVELVLAVLRAQAAAGAAESHRAEAARASQRDALTDTPNRSAMLDRLHLAVASAQRRHARCAVLFIDIDRFKSINDRYGHPVGDAVLQCIARRLVSNVRETDAVGRFGGEEFLVVLDDIASKEAVTGVVQHLLHVLARPESIAGHAITLSASLGVAFYPDDGSDVETLVACSDAAMYRAKRRGRGGYAFCDEVADAADGASWTLSGLTAPWHDDIREGDDARAAFSRHAALQEANGMLVEEIMRSRAAEASAREAQARQLQSMAMAAHELRNPLVPIRLASDLLDGARDDRVRFDRLRDIIEEQVVQIARLVDDLVDGARVTTGRLHVELAMVTLATVLDSALLGARPAIAARRQSLAVDLPPGDAMPMHGDRTRLVQVFANLLDNACKYTPEGGAIHLAAARVGAAWEVTIRDSGIGIPAAALDHVFDLFVRDADAAALRPGGLGIGLAIVRELVEAHGGTVACSSAGTGQGSVFVVALPASATA